MICRIFFCFVVFFLRVLLVVVVSSLMVFVRFLRMVVFVGMIWVIGWITVLVRGILSGDLEVITWLGYVGIPPLRSILWVFIVNIGGHLRSVKAVPFIQVQIIEVVEVNLFIEVDHRRANKKCRRKGCPYAS
jgi:hypothetical protein